MGKGKRQPTLRFASGTPDKPYSNVWHLVVQKDDVYIARSTADMGRIKISLHKSGVWALAATLESGATFDGNRRAKRWERPLEHAAGVTRGPSIVALNTSLGPRKPLLPEQRRDDIVWFDAPQPGELVEFSLYFVKPGAVEDWGGGQFQLAERVLANGTRTLLFADARPAPLELRASVEELLRTQVFTVTDPQNMDGSLLVYSERKDTETGSLTIPTIFDHPLPMQKRGWVALKR